MLNNIFNRDKSISEQLQIGTKDEATFLKSPQIFLENLHK
jgi:hypothetical protein